MSVVVGITTQNRCDVLPKAIRSALAQKAGSLAVTVFDDYSQDATPLVRHEFPEVTWERSEEIRGLVFARNKMMKEAASRYFCSLDDDAWFMETDELDLAVTYMDQHPDVAAIAFDILSPDSPVIQKRSLPVETANFIGCGHILRLEAVRQVGYYELYPAFYGSEEKDLCIKLIDRGYRIFFMPGVHVWHDKINLEQDEVRKHQSVVCNDLVFWYRRSPLLVLLPGLIYKMAVHLRFSTQYKNGVLFSATVKGILRFATQFSKLKRQPVTNSTFQKFSRLAKTKITKG